MVKRAKNKAHWTCNKCYRNIEINPFTCDITSNMWINGAYHIWDELSKDFIKCPYCYNTKFTQNVMY